MSETSPVTNPELFESIDQEVQGKAVVIEKKRRRRRRQSEEEIPLPLSKLSGKEVIEILDFLHKRYLSWMTEAEASKYSTVYRSAKEEALKETLDLYSELQKQVLETIKELKETVEALRTIHHQQIQRIPQETAKEVKKGLLEDPRVRALIFVGLESFLGNNPKYQELRPIIRQILMPETILYEQQRLQQIQQLLQQEQQATPQEQRVENVEQEISDLEEEEE